MLWPHIVLPFLLILEFHVDDKCPTDDWVMKDDWQPITSFMESRCSSDSKSFAEISKSWMDDGILCWARITPGSQNTVSWCTDFPEKSYYCVKNVMDKLETYMVPEEKYFPDFMLSSYNYTMEQLCKNGDDGFQEIRRKADNQTCKDHTGIMSVRAMTKCIPTMKFMHDVKDIDAVMNKSDFCNNFREIKECIIDSLEEECPNHGFSSFLETILDSHLYWCAKNL